MVDESFHLTPVEVRRWDFGQKFRGADPIQVENFRNRVAEELERLTRVNQELEAKAKGFHEQLRAFRERDKALNDALVSAQQLRGEIREQADREGQVLLRETRVEADKILEQARADARAVVEQARAESRQLLEDSQHQLRALQNDVQQLDKARRALAAQLRAIVERQLSELQVVEASIQSPAGRVPTAATRPTQPPTAPASPERDVLMGPPMSTMPTAGARPTPAASIPNLPIPDVGLDAEGERNGNGSRTPRWLETWAPGAPKE